jgi:hypothetical protein
MQRRDFLKNTLTASAVATLASHGASAADSASAKSSVGGRDYYELRAYRLKAGTASSPMLDAYLEKALIPALNSRGIAHVGVFTEPEAKDGPAVWVLIPHPSLESVASVTASLNTDPAVLAAGAEYLQTPKASPAFERIDSWLLLAFKGMPKLVLPATTAARQPRIFEMRSYESYSEVKALKKMAMFDDGEIEVMNEVGLAPVFFGQALAGRDLPHLTYITSATDREAHKAHWAAFGKHPTWIKMKNDPQYADTVSKNTARFLVPTAYSQI